MLIFSIRFTLTKHHNIKKEELENYDFSRKKKMKKLLKKPVIFVLSFIMILSTMVCITPENTLAADVEYLAKGYDAAAANQEMTYSFTVAKEGKVYFDIYAPTPIAFTVIFKNSAGTQI